MNIETKVYEVIDERIKKMGELDPTTDEYKANADVALKFIDRATEIEKLHIEEEANRQKFQLEEEANRQKLQLEEEANRQKLQQMEDDRKDRFVRNILTGLSIAVPPTVALIAAFGFSVLERTEIVASTPAREFMKRALRLS